MAPVQVANPLSIGSAGCAIASTLGYFLVKSSRRVNADYPPGCESDQSTKYSQLRKLPNLFSVSRKCQEAVRCGQDDHSAGRNRGGITAVFLAHGHNVEWLPILQTQHNRDVS